MRLSVSAGSKNTGGRVSTSTLHVRVIEWHAREGNTGAVYIGASDVNSTNGRELPPGEAVRWNFTNMGRDGEPGHVVFSDFYCTFEQAGDWLDWTILTTND